MAKLRGHHLICLHFYDGEGYDGGFIDNLEQVLARAVEGGVQAVEGPDDVCRPCPHRRGEQCTFSATADREIREMDRRALALLGVAAGEKIGWARLRSVAEEVFPEWSRRHCSLCPWRGACERSPFFRRLANAESREET